MNISYALSKGTLQEFINVKEDLASLKAGLSPSEIRAGITDIYAGASVFALDESGNPEDCDLYIIDEEGTAHIPVVGLLVPKANPCAAFFGNAETEYPFITLAVQKAEQDYSVKNIQLDITSPGGYVEGVDLTARTIAESSKPTTAFVTSLAASGAYWLASQCDRITASSPTDWFGSIGVVLEEVDRSEAEKSKGIRRNVYTSTDAPDKRIDTSTEDGRDKIIAQLDDTHRVFVSRVAAGRGVSVETVNSDFGRGGLLIAEKALEAGMIDEVRGSIGTKAGKGQKPGVTRRNTAVLAGETEEVKITMTLEELKTTHPGVYAEAVGIGVTDGVKQERERRNSLERIAAVDPENETLAGVISAAITEGTAVDDMALQTKISVAVRDGKKLTGENPPLVGTDTVQETKKKDQLSAEEQAEAKKVLDSLSKLGG